MERVFDHAITYTNRGVVSVADVAASLVANEKLLKDAGAVLQELFPGLTVHEVEVRFRSATTSSPLKELLAGAFVLSYQEELRAEVPMWIERLTGIDIPDSSDGIITVLVMVILIYGVAKAVELFGPKKAGGSGEQARSAPMIEPQAVIQGNYNQVVLVAGEKLGVDPTAITEALDRKFHGRNGRNLAQKAMQMIRPAKREAGAAIEGGGLRVDPETIEAAPSDLDLLTADEQEIQEPIQAQFVDIHATDIDSNNTGWAGVLSGVWDKRLRMRLYPTIQPEELFGKRTIIADVILVSKANGLGEHVPYLFHVVRILEGDAGAP